MRSRFRRARRRRSIPTPTAFPDSAPRVRTVDAGIDEVRGMAARVEQILARLEAVAAVGVPRALIRVDDDVRLHRHEHRGGVVESKKNRAEEKRGGERADEDCDLL